MHVEGIVKYAKERCESEGVDVIVAIPNFMEESIHRVPGQTLLRDVVFQAHGRE